MYTYMIDNRLCWSDISLFLQCPQCFWRSKHLGIKRPKSDPESFRLPCLIDELRKDECDRCRITNTTLKIFEKNGIAAVPYEDEVNSVKNWRKPFFEGGTLEYYDIDRNLIVCGSLDDVFINTQGELIVVEFKSTSTKQGESIKANSWYKFNQLQVIFYAWLLNKNNKEVHPTGYLIYSDALRSGPEILPFNNRLFFKTVLAACPIDYAQIDQIIDDMIYCLLSETPPDLEIMGYKNRCHFCRYINAITDNYRNVNKLLI